jgi:penicillin amidase
MSGKLLAPQPDLSILAFQRQPMARLRKAVVVFPLVTFAAAALLILSALLVLRGPLPAMDGEETLQGLSAPVQVEFDTFGIPRFEARTRKDAFRALGFVTARDRLFQMDLMRRKSAGTLAEVFGERAVETDRWHRVMGFEQVAQAIVTGLPPEQQAVLNAYAQGVNEAIAQTKVWPFEFLLLGYAPSPWRMEDSLLVVLGMFEKLSWSGDVERSVSIMDKALPKSVTAFLTPDTDPYTDQLAKGQEARRPLRLPSEADFRLLEPADVKDLTSPPEISKGSNAWVVSPEKARDGHAILANDMHLDLGVPNVWYRAELHYGKSRLAGVTLPGVPAVVTGTNHHVAWGFTNTEGDFVDLVRLDIPAQDPDAYQTPDGPRRFGERRETIRVRDGEDVSFTVRTTIWGPVLPKPLLGQAVAVHWIALDPSALNMDLMEMDGVNTVPEAMAIFNRAGAPPQNVLIADAEGNIGWTLMGRIPARFGMDGIVSQSWADGSRGWRGYVEPEAYPRVINPPSGFLASANQRMVGKEYPHAIGHNYANGYRAYRITERLREMVKITEEDMLHLQLDTYTEFYSDYQRLALVALKSPIAEKDPEATRLAEILETWNGQANPDSLGLPLLVEFRRVLLDAVLSPVLARCRAIDPGFVYNWRNPDGPLLKLLSTRRLELLSSSSHYPDWDAFIRSMLKRSAERLSANHPGHVLEKLTWGEAQKTAIQHPLSTALPWLGWLLDMPRDPLPGCVQCVRAFTGRIGATERLVVSPGHEDQALLHMPGGQSGHPLSPHYRDQHPYWAEGRPMPLLSEPAQHRLILRP